MPCSSNQGVDESGAANGTAAGAAAIETQDDMAQEHENAQNRGKAQEVKGLRQHQRTPSRGGVCLFSLRCAAGAEIWKAAVT